jgi:signal transduction histidine kinase
VVSLGRAVAQTLTWLAVLSSAGAVAVAARLEAITGPVRDNGAHIGKLISSTAVGSIGLSWTLTGAFLAWRRPRNILGWLFLLSGMFTAWSSAIDAYAMTLYGESDEAAHILAETLYPVDYILFFVGYLIIPTVGLALYPSGRLPNPWWRWPIAGTAAGILLLALGVIPALYPVIPPSYLEAGVIIFGSSGLAIWIGTALRLIQASQPQRQQLALLLFAVVAHSLLLVLSLLPYDVSLWLLILAQVSGFFVAVAVAVAVLRYRLLGIETVLRRGFVYGTLTVLVAAVYLSVTALAGLILDNRPIPGVLAAAVVAVGLAPARDWLQRIADRVVYGERRDPLRAVAQLGQQVTVTEELGLLPAALASVAAAVRAPGAVVAALDGRIVASIGVEPVGGPVLLLGFGGRWVGELRVAPLRSAEAYTDSQLRLLAALAPQIAVVVRALDLTEALQAERDRVIAATIAERDRLRRDLHDGLGPSLSGIGLGLQAVSDTMRGDSPAAEALIGRIKAEVDTTIAEIRRIIDDLRPAALDTMGLTEAIRRYAQTISTVLPVEVHAADLPPIPPQVENAAYRITTEALTNVARHAEARHVLITLSAPNRTLRITVADDGHGVTTATVGVGLTSMRRRADTLGGHLDVASTHTGTTVTTTLPLEQP